FGLLRVTKRPAANRLSLSGLRRRRPGYPEPYAHHTITACARQSCLLCYRRVKWKSPVQGPGFSALGGVRLDRAIPAVGIRHRAKYSCTLMRIAGAKRGVQGGSLQWGRHQSITV